ncbi:hypothetical protein HNY73_006480 [Argiope bruennichi]|uniref:Uncharacterized protein n=1 Tax=Argiope bruennichi TaxID=94029 RepID=A0A8T0FPT2_ARGBR|nr:hypothetical protein HNY73_006480 [Argiope bruennichi]
MQLVLKGFKNVECSIDDIFIRANTKDELQKLTESVIQKLRELTESVIQRLRENGEHLNKEKCAFDILISDALSRNCKMESLQISSEELNTFEIILDLPPPLTTYPELLSASNEDTKLQQLTIDNRLALLNWQNTPSKELPSPAQRLFRHPTRALIPLYPSQSVSRMLSSCSLRKIRKTICEFQDIFNNSPIFVKGYAVKLKTANRNRIPGIVLSASNTPRYYYVIIPDGNILRRNSKVIHCTKADIAPDCECVFRNATDCSTQNPAKTPSEQSNSFSDPCPSSDAINSN